MQSLSNVSNSLLLESLKKLKGNENITIADIVLHLSELDTRGLYRDIGYSSLYSYCREALGYSEGASYRRIQAAKALKDNPEVYQLLRDGKLSLCAVAEVSKVIKPDNKEELLNSAQGKAKLEVQKIVARYQEPERPGRERIVVTKVAVEADSLFNQTQEPEIKEELKLTFTVAANDEFNELLNEARSFIGNVPLVEVFKRTLKEFVDRRKKAPRTGKKSSNTTTRYISKAVKHEVRKRDQNRCTDVSSDSHRCSETCGLEFEHIRPFSLGGGNDISNIRLLCSTHNKLLAERVYGKEKINSYINI